jgi:hypothetical protein
MYTSDPRANVGHDLSIFRSKLSYDILSGAPRLVTCCTSHKRAVPLSAMTDHISQLSLLTYITL